MSDIKEETISLIKKLPDDSTIDDILDAITLQKKILRGIKDLEEGNYITDEEMQKRIDAHIRTLN